MLRLRSFGSVGLEDAEGHALDAVLAQPKRLALLIFLAAARPAGVHRRDQLLALFWPDLDEARARDALNQALRFLRQALGAETVVSRGAEEVGIDPARLWCDAVSFRDALDGGRAAEALELYRGEFLQGFFIEEGGGFEEWMERERVALRESAARGARQLADQLAAEGSLTLAMTWGKRALELAPDDERALRRLLRLHDRAGDRAGAFRVYEAFVHRFEEEFGGEPSPETRALAEQLRAGQPLAEERGVSPRPAVASPRPGAGELQGVIGDRYRIVRKLGAGGMATVYLAHDVKHDRDVALKVLRPEVAEGLARERFVREIRIAGRLQHPNIVPLFDSGVVGDRLYYVMAHIEGETLRDRLVREGRFGFDEVRHVLREVAGALAYAHERGVIHRDIKPENILLIDQRAVLADFGIARAAHFARTPSDHFDTTLTQPGTSLGTPAYMAPEQAVGDPDVDGRADLYAMGVLGYEMLAGRTPFVGYTGHEILAAQLTQQPVLLTVLRPDTPTGLGALLMRCLEKKPAERPRSAQEFLAELEQASSPALAAEPRKGGTPASYRTRLSAWGKRYLSRRPVLAAGAILLLGAAAVVASRLGLTSPFRKSSAAAALDSVDSLRYAILPFSHDGDALAGLHLEQFLQDGLSRWEGLSLVDRFQLNDAMARRDTTRLTSEDARRVAAELGAGRYIRTAISSVGDSLRVHAVLYETVRGRLLADASLRLPRNLASADSGFAVLADRLLFRGAEAGASPGMPVGTRSLPARVAYSLGLAAIQEWELATADSQFVRATELDGEYVEAFLWLAQMRSWRGLPAEQWGFAADRASAGRKRLTERDRQLSDALVALSSGEIPRACATLIRLTERQPHDFAAWYGMGTCLSRDSVVVRDRNSPSGWTFRSSYSAALAAYIRAFQLLPSIHRALRDRAFEPVRALLKTSTMYPRSGTSGAPGAQSFAAYPSWTSDSLGFIPWPMSDFLKPDPKVIPQSTRIAVQQQRELFHRVAAGWAAIDPQSPDALEALALSLEMLADPACLESLLRAEALTRSPQERLRLAGVEVWMRLKFALPHDIPGIRTVRRMADSLLREHPNGGGPSTALLVSLAVLTGRAGLAATLVRDVRPEAFWDVPPQISRSAAPLLVLAALGGPRDSVNLLAEQVQTGIDRVLPATAKERARSQWLVRPATLIFPDYVPAWLARLDASGDYLLEAQHHYMRGDTSAVRRALEALRVVRQDLPREDLALDALYPEAALLAALGDPRAASTWLDPALTSFSKTSPQVSGDPAQVGAIVRASALRAELAERIGDSLTARRWAIAVTILWSDADQFLQPVVDRMRRLAK